MPVNPLGGAAGGGASESWKYAEFAHVPLTRTYAGPSAAASLRNRGRVRSVGGIFWNIAGSDPPMTNPPAPASVGGGAGFAFGSYGFQKSPPMTSAISTL